MKTIYRMRKKYLQIIHLVRELYPENTMLEKIN